MNMMVFGFMTSSRWNPFVQNCPIIMKITTQIHLFRLHGRIGWILELHERKGKLGCKNCSEILSDTTIVGRSSILDLTGTKCGRGVWWICTCHCSEATPWWTCSIWVLTEIMRLIWYQENSIACIYWKTLAYVHWDLVSTEQRWGTSSKQLKQPHASSKTSSSSMLHQCEASLRTSGKMLFKENLTTAAPIKKKTRCGSSKEVPFWL